MSAAVRSLLVLTLLAIGGVASKVEANPNTQVVAIEGSVVPEGNGVFVSLRGPVLNDAGEVAFLASVSESGGESTGVFRWHDTAGTVQIARGGQPAPDGNGVSLFFSAPAINQSGQIAYRGSFTGTAAGSDDSLGIFRGDGLTAPVQIVRQGQAAPNGDGYFEDFGVSSFSNAGAPSLAINGFGDVAFRATLRGTSGGSEDDSGIFLGDGVSDLLQIVREGQSAPDGNGTLGGFSEVTMNDAGMAAFGANLTGTDGGASDDLGIYRFDGTTGLVQIARSGQASPDGNGVLDTLDNALINEANQVAFEVSFTGASSGLARDEGVLYGNGFADPVLIVRSGEAAPDGNGAIGRIDLRGVNALGHVVYSSLLDNTVGGSFDQQGIFRADGANPTVQIARAGELAPDGNGTFDDLTRRTFVAMNDVGQVAFQTYVTNTVDTGDSLGIFFYDDDLGLLQVAREGDAFLGSTISYLEFNDTALRAGDELAGLNDVGQVAFVFGLEDGRSGVAIWTVPVPEPNALPLVVLWGTVLLVSQKRYRSHL